MRPYILRTSDAPVVFRTHGRFPIPWALPCFRVAAITVTDEALLKTQASRGCSKFGILGSLHRYPSRIRRKRRRFLSDGLIEREQGTVLRFTSSSKRASH